MINLQVTKKIVARPLKLETVTWSIALWFTMLALLYPPIRYIAYLVPFLALFHGLAEGYFKVPDISKPMLILVIAGLCLSPLADADGFKDIFFIVSGISISLVIKQARFNPYYLLGLFCFGTISYAFIYNGLSHGFVFDLARSKSSFEGNFAFLFGLLAVYAVLTRQWKLLIFSFIGSIFALKRIVIIAEIVCILLILLPEQKVKRLLNPFFLIVINVTFVLTVILYANHSFDSLINFYTGQSADQFGMGRQELYNIIANDILVDPIRYFFIGAGPGAAYNAISGLAGHANLHSDILKIMYEYGFIIFSLFIYFGYSSQFAALRILFLFTNIVFITDNVLIYHFFLFFLCGFGLAVQKSKEELNNSAQILN